MAKDKTFFTRIIEDRTENPSKDFSEIVKENSPI